MTRFCSADYCPTCGQPRELGVAAIERLGLSLSCGNLLSFGERAVRIRPAMAEFMRALIERGRASHEFLLLRLESNTESNVVQVYACKLRRVLRELTDDQVSLTTVWGWGFELARCSIAEGKAA